MTFLWVGSFYNYSANTYGNSRGASQIAHPESNTCPSLAISKPPGKPLTLSSGVLFLRETCFLFRFCCTIILQLQRPKNHCFLFLCYSPQYFRDATPHHPPTTIFTRESEKPKPAGSTCHYLTCSQKLILCFSLLAVWPGENYFTSLCLHLQNGDNNSTYPMGCCDK